MHKDRVLFVTCLAAAIVSCSKTRLPQHPVNTQQAATLTATSSVVNATKPNQPTTDPVSDASKTIDACALLTSKEIQAVQGEPLKETTLGGRSEGGFLISQCYFALPTSANSISLLVTQRGESSGARDPKEFWKETFHRDEAAEPGRQKEKLNKRGEVEQADAGKSEKIAGVGDEAYWTGNRVGGALYALQGNAYIRIGIGGPGDKAAKIRKSKALAQIILKRL